METNPRDYGERCRFDAFCKTVLKHEAIDYIREMKRRANREMSLERLPQTAMDKLCSADDYPSDSYVFSYCGYDLFPRCQFRPQDIQRFCSAPLDGTPGQAKGLADLAVRQIQNQAQNQNTLLLLRQTGKGVGHPFIADRQVIAAVREYIAVAGVICTRTVYDENGCPHACLDEYMKSRLENKLIRAILGMN